MTSMNELEKNMDLLKEILEELRDIVHLKDDDIPSEAWQERYNFLERLKEHYSGKISYIKWSQVRENLNILREEQREERLKESKGIVNPYKQEMLNEIQERNISERKQQRRESHRRNLKAQKKNVLKEIQRKEDVES